MKKSLPENVLQAIANKNYCYTNHVNQRKNERGLQNIDICKAAQNGEVIEHIEAYNLGEKYIIYAVENEKVFHIVLAYNKCTVCFLTV